MYVWGTKLRKPQPEIFLLQMWRFLYEFGVISRARKLSGATEPWIFLRPGKCGYSVLLPMKSPAVYSHYQGASSAQHEAACRGCSLPMFSIGICPQRRYIYRCVCGRQSHFHTITAHETHCFFLGLLTRIETDFLSPVRRSLLPSAMHGLEDLGETFPRIETIAVIGESSRIGRALDWS